MSRLRSFSFPRITSSFSKLHDDNMARPCSPAHSRDSSGGSSNTSPLTPTFSSRGHSRFPSSTSSLVTNPDSPANPQKSTLHDLVEDPSERDDPHELWDDDGDDSSSSSPPEALCICDTPWCQHRQHETHDDCPAPLATPEWSPGDDYFDNGHLPGDRIIERPRSNDHLADSFASRVSRQFSKRFGGHRSSGSVSTINLRSAPNSRPSSLRLPTTRSFTAPNAHEVRNVTSLPLSVLRASTPERSISPPRSRAVSQTISKPMDICIPEIQEDLIERQELATTPLLPPMKAGYFTDSQEAMQSPLTSPTVASPSAVPSMSNTPVSSPIAYGCPTPPLSAKASTASLNMRSSHVLQPASEIPPLTIAEETDHWAIKLGHANFNIYPEPYLPDVCDAQHCRQLRDDWEAARVEYMRQAARVSEHYGVTSHIYKLTEQKWAEIDGVWRANHELANAEAQASGEETVFQPLAETRALKKMPSLQDPERPSKFPLIEEADIVGPMVQYAKIQHRRQPSKKSSFLKIFTDFARPHVGSQR